ncbi:hypothetical protein BU24DRAFT_279683 [Aaosphaeria arxii CBS 175.79]|uniref:Uncharacterized protein n=1 Tax=Aaosphaeria arxii CBS 175.79 TaxID=1450172 RepID=A0A6A5XEQ1_9PLEO|nr:uncharacterized protein BU24DRAFT_279683 [Aaosphaeria arxii CBS 175.79]KAF2011359.1 hypothetical protein BU24DRAFT_279683 [Aaosphaeria arxii CBS 175.79]
MWKWRSLRALGRESHTTCHTVVTVVTLRRNRLPPFASLLFHCSILLHIVPLYLHHWPASTSQLTLLSLNTTR